MSKETVAGIGKAIEEAQRAKNLREEQRIAQELAEKQTEKLRLEAERQALIDRNEARLRATGVVGLFEELRDNGIVKFSEEPLIERREESFLGIKWGSEVKIADYQPAKVFYQNELNHSEIDIQFDGHYYYERWGDGNFERRLSSCVLDARITEKGVLQVGEHEMKPGEKLGDVVRDEILRLKGLRE